MTRFTGNAIAGNSLFAPVYVTNHAGTSTFADGGVTEFRDDSNAGGAIVENLRSFAGATAGATKFFDSASGGNGTFRNAPGPLSYYATIEFNGNSSGGNGTFVNLPGVLGESVGGAIVFNDNSTAETGTYTSQGEGGTVTFNHHADAQHGTFATADNIGGNSSIHFFAYATAGQAEFSLGYNTALQFLEYSTAAAANITARQGGYVLFSGSFTADYSATSTAANAQIMIDGGSVVGATRGHAGFSTWSTAGNATITANGASASGALGATIAFDYSAHAGDATLIANGGTNGGAGAAIYFRRAATGDNSRIVVKAGGVADFGGNIGYGGTTVGSIEGARHIRAQWQRVAHRQPKHRTLPSPEPSWTFSAPTPTADSRRSAPASSRSAAITPIPDSPPSRPGPCSSTARSRATCKLPPARRSAAPASSGAISTWPMARSSLPATAPAHSAPDRSRSTPRRSSISSSAS